MSEPNATIQSKTPNAGGTSPLQQVTDAAATFGESLKHASTDAAAQARQAAQNVAGQAGEALQHAKDKAQETVQSAINDAASAGQHAKEKAQEAAASVPGKVNDIGDEVASVIRRYPVQSALCALALGFILAHTLRNHAAGVQ